MSQLDTHITEVEWQAKVIDFAHLNGWLVFHNPKANTPEGWRTPVAADGKGFPDLILVSPRGVLFRELKTQTGRLSPGQKAWGMALAESGADYAVWRPADWPTVVTKLTMRFLRR